MTAQRQYDDLTDADFTPDEALTVVERWEDVPQFASEDEAAEWWDTHSLADHLWDTTRRGPPTRLAEQAAVERARRGLTKPPQPRRGRRAAAHRPT